MKKKTKCCKKSVSSLKLAANQLKCYYYQKKKFKLWYIYSNDAINYKTLWTIRGDNKKQACYKIINSSKSES